MQTYNEKIAGSSFYPVSVEELHGKVDGKAHKLSFQGAIIPEPENEYDAHAKRVEIQVANPDGTTTRKVGYLKKDSPLYRRTKVNVHKVIPCAVDIITFANVGLNNSVQLQVTI